MKHSISLSRNISFLALSLFMLFASCSKDKDSTTTAPTATFAGQYLVVDDETYTLVITSKGGNNFQISEFGGFLNVPLNAVANGSTLTIPSQTFTNPSGKSITVTGTGKLSTKTKKDDTISFEYAVTGYTSYESDFVGSRK
jgi:hypothetical protein